MKLPGHASVIIESKKVDADSSNAMDHTECATISTRNTSSIFKFRGFVPLYRYSQCIFSDYYLMNCSEEVQSKYVPGATWVFDAEEGQSAVFTRPAASGEGAEGGGAMDVYTITAREVGKQAVDDFMDDFEADVVEKERASANSSNYPLLVPEPQEIQSRKRSPAADSEAEADAAQRYGHIVIWLIVPTLRYVVQYKRVHGRTGRYSGWNWMNNIVQVLL
jgi:hypothetical protein